MDGDGELHLGDDVNASLPCASESAERHSGNNMKDARDTGTNDNNNNGHGGGSCSGGDAGGGGSDGDDDGGGDGDKGKDDDDDADDDDDDNDEDEEDEDEFCEEMREDDDDDDSDEDRMHIDIPEEGEGEDDKDSTDGEPPSSIVSPGTAAEATVTTEKRVPVQSQRMRDYQEMQQTASQASRPRPCPHCDRILYSGPGFRYHLSTHHAGKESFTCEFCPRKFKSLNGLKYHQKPKRCKGLAAHQVRAGPPLHMHTRTNFEEEEFPGQRLMELAKIATSPQSPLLQSPGPDSRGGATGTFFDYSEASAAMALSSMMRSSESRKSVEGCSSSSTKYSSLQQQQQQQQQHPQQHLQHHQQQQQQHPQQHLQHHQQLQQQQHHLHHQHNQQQHEQHQKQPPQPQQNLPSQDSKSKRPMNGFMLFAQQHRAELKKKYPNTNNRVISTKLSEEWAQLPDNVRQQWKDEAKVKAEQQLKEHPDCWKRKK